MVSERWCETNLCEKDDSVSKMMWRLCVLRLPRERQPRPQRRPRAPQLVQEALCTAPATRTRAAACPGGSVYCACHAKGSRCPSGGHARRSSSRRLCVLRLPRERQPRPQRRPRAPRSSRRLCVLRLPRERQPRPQRRPRAPQLLEEVSVYCACHPRPQRRPRAPQLVQEALCTAPATPKAAAAPAAATRAALVQEALCTAPATRKAAAAPAAATRAAAPPGGLCVLRLPRERQPRPQRRPRAPQLVQEALCTAPATPKTAAAPAAATRAAACPGGSVYCACHAKGSRGPSGGHARRSSSRRLCVLRLPRERQPRPHGHARRSSALYCACLSE